MTIFFQGLLYFILGLGLIFFGLPHFLQKFILNKIFPDKKIPDAEIKTTKASKRSRHISQSVKDKVWNRDGGRCVECGSNEDIEFDHIIPHSKGGANTYRNIQLLCEPCNRSKSAKIG